MKLKDIYWGEGEGCHVACAHSHTLARRMMFNYYHRFLVAERTSTVSPFQLNLNI